MSRKAGFHVLDDFTPYQLAQNFTMDNLIKGIRFNH